MDRKYSRDRGGKFDFKSDAKREVRSLRATDAVWDKLGKSAERRGITRSDLIEEMACSDETDTERVIEILEEALLLRANAGGAIKEKIRMAIDLLKGNF